MPSFPTRFRVPDRLPRLGAFDLFFYFYVGPCSFACRLRGVRLGIRAEPATYLLAVFCLAPPELRPIHSLPAFHPIPRPSPSFLILPCTSCGCSRFPCLSSTVCTSPSSSPVHPAPVSAGFSPRNWVVIFPDGPCLSRQRSLSP